MKSIKSLIRKCHRSNEDMQKGLLIFRNTPLACGKSPAELLQGRQLTDNLPSIKFHHKPTEQGRNIVQERKSAKAYYDQFKPKEGTKFHPDETVAVQDDATKEWTKQGRLDRHVAPRSYLVKLSSGQSIRRNQRFWRKVYSLSSHGITDCSMLANSQEDDSDEESDSTIPYREDFGEESDREEYDRTEEEQLWIGEESDRADYDEEQLSIEEESDATVPYGDERVFEMAETKMSRYGRRIHLKQPVDYDEL